MGKIKKEKILTENLITIIDLELHRGGIVTINPYKNIIMLHRLQIEIAFEILEDKLYSNDYFLDYLEKRSNQWLK
jgi:hypothetical protein